MGRSALRRNRSSELPSCSGPWLLPEAPPRARRIIGIGNALRLWIENGETVLASKLMHKPRNIIGLGPHARHDDVRSRKGPRLNSRPTIISYPAFPLTKQPHTDVP